jgi:hypothetical protein
MTCHPYSPYTMLKAVNLVHKFCMIHLAFIKLNDLVIPTISLKQCNRKTEKLIISSLPNGPKNKKISPRGNRFIFHCE